MMAKQLKKRPTKLVRFVYLFAVVWLLIIASFGISFHVPGYLNNRAPSITVAKPFDAARWQSKNATDRYAMAKHLDESNQLIGLSKSDVLAMLGPHDNIAYDGSYFTWRLGERGEQAFSFNRFDFLVVTFDSNDLCEKCYVRGDSD